MTWLAHPGHDSLRRAFAVYLRRVLLPARAPGIRPPEAADLMELKTMLNETYTDWSVQYLRQGREEGRVAGRAEGKAEMLARQLTRRFGALTEAATQHLKSATDEQLDLWSDRVLDAPNLDAVFEGH